MAHIKVTIPDRALHHMDYLIDELHVEDSRSAIARKAILQYLQSQPQKPPSTEPILPFEQNEENDDY